MSANKKARSALTGRSLAAARCDTSIVHRHFAVNSLSKCQCITVPEEMNSNLDEPSRRRLSPECAEDPELKALFMAAIRTNVGFLKPEDAKIFWRVEILCQPLSQVALETGLSKADICRCLQSARSDLVRLLVLSLQPPTDT